MREVKIEQYLPPEALKTMKGQLVPLFTQKLTARKLVPVVNVPAPTMEHGYDIDLQDNSQEAEIVAPGGDIPRDTPDGRKRILNSMQKNVRGYEIPYEYYINNMYRTRSVLKTVKAVAKKDDDIIINGYKRAGVYGLVDIPAGTISPTNGSWADASSSGGTPYHDMVKLLGQLRTQSGKAFGDNPKALTVVMDSIAETTLYMTHLAEAQAGQPTMNRLEKLFGNILVVPSMPQGRVILMETGPEFGELIMAEDFTIERPMYSVDNMSYNGNIYVRSVPVWYRHGDVEGQSTAVAALDNVLP